MRPILSLAVAFPALCFLFSCHKIGVYPHPPHNPGDSAYTLNLTYYNTDTTIAPGIELIISVPGGKVLLDSISAFNVPIFGTLHTSAAVVDVTTVYYSATY